MPNPMLVQNAEGIVVNQDFFKVLSDDKTLYNLVTRVEIGRRIREYIILRHINFGRNASLHLAYACSKKKFVGIKIAYRDPDSKKTPDCILLAKSRSRFFPRYIESFDYSAETLYRVEVYEADAIGMSLVDIHASEIPIVLDFTALLKIINQLITMTRDLQKKRGFLHVDVYPHNIIMPATIDTLYLGVVNLEASLPWAEAPIKTHRGESTKLTSRQVKTLIRNIVLKDLPKYFGVFFHSFNERILDRETKFIFSHYHSDMFTENVPIIGYSKSYCAPEIIFGAGQTEAVDVWNIGCIIYFLASGRHLFGHTTDNPKDTLAEIIETVGELEPHAFAHYPMFKKFFDAKGKCVINATPLAQADRLETIHIEGSNGTVLVDFIRSLLTVDPRKRPCLTHVKMHPLFSTL